MADFFLKSVEKSDALHQKHLDKRWGEENKSEGSLN